MPLGRRRLHRPRTLLHALHSTAASSRCRRGRLRSIPRRVGGRLGLDARGRGTRVAGRGGGFGGLGRLVRGGGGGAAGAGGDAAVLLEAVLLVIAHMCGRLC